MDLMFTVGELVELFKDDPEFTSPESEYNALITLCEVYGLEVSQLDVTGALLTVSVLFQMELQESGRHD